MIEFGVFEAQDSHIEIGSRGRVGDKQHDMAEAQSPPFAAGDEARAGWRNERRGTDLGAEKELKAKSRWIKAREQFQHAALPRKFWIGLYGNSRSIEPATDPGERSSAADFPTDIAKPWRAVFHRDPPGALIDFGNVPLNPMPVVLLPTRELRPGHATPRWIRLTQGNPALQFQPSVVLTLKPTRFAGISLVDRSFN